jgi:hypothetical protein
MDHPPGGTHPWRLRALDGDHVPAAEAVGEAILACLEDAPQGLPVRSLPGAVAERLGVAATASLGQRVTSALGLLIATGCVDEVGGRLVTARGEQRRAG